MLERVVVSMFRSATRTDSQSSSTEKMDTSIFNEKESEMSSETCGDIEIDNSNHVLLKIATLYTEKLMTDICLVVGGIEYPAHRLILCTSSDVFQVMLMDSRWSESREKRVVLQETLACSAVFGEFLKYFYTGRIKINLQTIMPILALADKYNVKELTPLCVQYMCDHIAHAAMNNELISWFHYTLALGHYQVAKGCQNFIKWNLELISKTSDFGSLHHELLGKLLQQNDVVVQNEMAVYNCVVHWLNLQKQQMIEDSEPQVDACMESLVQDMMSHVRFPMMTPRQLAELLLSPLTKQYKEFFIERMAMGMSFHSGQAERVAEICQVESGRLLFTPRLYTADKWSSLLTVENFIQLPAYHTRTLVFSSHAFLEECAGEKTCEWVSEIDCLYH
uniref:BTB domain-containing protein n=2 Tax=Clastoptera arizonana TaxID=38151 RepID=A0A1B6D5W6_9HEMI